MTANGDDYFESLEYQCVRFSAQPPNERPLDALWDTYARDPSRASHDFWKHLPEYDQPIPPSRAARGIPGKLKVAAAFGGVILASEAGDQRAHDAYRRMRPEIRRVGHTILGLVTQSISERFVPGAGSALGIYLAASATDLHPYTAWGEGARPIPGDVLPLHKPRTPGTPLEPRENNTDQHIEVIGHLRLHERYFQGRLIDKLGVLTRGYAEVVDMTGSLTKFLNNPRDRISMQHIEDFVSTCLRLAGVSSLEDTDALKITGMAVQEKTNPLTAEMFYASARLLRKRNVPVKGPNTHGDIDPREVKRREEFQKTSDDWDRRLTELFDAIEDKTGNDPTRSEQVPDYLDYLVDKALETDEDLSQVIDKLPFEQPTQEPKQQLSLPSNEIESPNRLRPRKHNSIPVHPNDQLWRKFHGGTVDTHINQTNPNAPLLKIYRHPSSRGSHLPMCLVTPIGDPVDIGPNDIVMVYERDKKGAVKPRPTNVFQGVNELPNGFTVLDAREPAHGQTPAPHSRILKMTSGALGRIKPESKQRKITEINSIESQDKSYVIYPMFGKSVALITPDGTLVRGSSGDIVVTVKHGANGAHRAMAFSTLGALTKAEGLYLTI